MSDLLEFQGISGHPNFGHFRRNRSFSTPTPGFPNHLALVTFFGGNVLKVEGGVGAEVPYEPLPESRQRIVEDLDYQI